MQLCNQYSSVLASFTQYYVCENRPHLPKGSCRLFIFIFMWQGLANLFWKEPESKYLRLCRLDYFFCTCLSLPVSAKAALVCSEWMWLHSNKTLFTRQEVVGYDGGLDLPISLCGIPFWAYGAIFLFKWLMEIRVVLSFGLLQRMLL